MQHLKPETNCHPEAKPKDLFNNLHRRSAAKIFGIVLTIAFIIGIAPTVFADVLEPVTPTKVPLEIPIGSVTAATLSEYIVVLHQYLVSTAAIFAVIYMMFGGYRWLFAAGNKQHVASAQDMIWTSAVGLFLALTSYILLFTLNPQTTKFPKLPIPYLSDKELTTESAKSICSVAYVESYRIDMELPEEWKPACGDLLEVRTDQEGTTVRCMATYTDESACAVTRNILGLYSKGEPTRKIQIRDLEGDKAEANFVAPGMNITCGEVYAGYGRTFGSKCQDYLPICYYIVGEPIVYNIDSDGDAMEDPGDDFEFVKGKPQCAPDI